MTGTATTGFTVTYTGAAANTDVPNFSIQNLNCGGCFAQVDETNHGGTFDSFTLNYNGNTSAPIVNGTNYTAAGLLAALTPILPAGTTATVAGFGGGNITANNQGFEVSFGGTQAATNVPFMLAVTEHDGRHVGLRRRARQRRRGHNKGGSITPTGNAIPVVTAPAGVHDPAADAVHAHGLATDANDDLAALQLGAERPRRRRGHDAAQQHEDERPAVRDVPEVGPDQPQRLAAVRLAGREPPDDDPSRTFPDLQQIIDNNTNADTGSCPQIPPIAPPVPQAITECFAEFLPTTDYVGFAGTNASPPRLDFRFTARDNKGGTNAAARTRR